MTRNLSTTDYRTVLSEILVRQMGMPPAEIQSVFPGYAGGGELNFVL